MSRRGLLAAFGLALAAACGQASPNVDDTPVPGGFTINLFNAGPLPLYVEFVYSLPNATMPAVHLLPNQPRSWWLRFRPTKVQVQATVAGPPYTAFAVRTYKQGVDFRGWESVLNVYF